MPYNAQSHLFDPDKKFLRKIAKESSSRKEAAAKCGVSARTLANRMEEKGLHKELEALVAKGRKRVGRKKKVVKKTPRKKTSKGVLKPVSRVGEKEVLDGEIREAHEELPSSNTELGDEFFGELQSKLSKLNGEQILRESGKERSAPVSSRKGDVCDLLVKIGNYLIDNT